MDVQYVINQTERLCKIAVLQNEYALKYVTNQTEELGTYCNNLKRNSLK